MNRLAAFLAAAMLVAGCAGHHINSGDSAAATGDWVRAEAEYRSALSSRPNEPGLAEKYARAKSEAIKQAKGRAQSCFGERNYPCATQQSEYVLALDANDAESQAMRTNAKRAQVIDMTDRAKAIAPSDAVQAFTLIDQAKPVSNDPQAVAAIRDATGVAIGAAVNQARALQSQAAQPGAQAIALYDKAIYLLEWCARADASQAGAVADAKAQKQRWIDGEYERLARIGDDAAARRDWKTAAQNYQAAEAFRAGGRARGLVVYANFCAQGDAAFAARDWKSAGAAYRSAAALPEDRNRYAASQVEQVDRAVEEDYRRLIGAGDEARARHDWAAALGAFQNADALRPGGPAAGRIEYVQVMQQGDAAVARRDWKAAADVYRRAAGWPEDQLDHYAAMQLDRVEVKPWRIRFKSVVIRALRPDGTPWLGRPSVQLAQSAHELITPQGQVNWHYVGRIPPENIPTLQLQVTMPDGKQYLSDSRAGIAPEFDASAVIETNAFEDRSVVLAVGFLPPQGAPSQVDSFNLAIKDLITGKPIAPGQSIAQVTIKAEPARPNDPPMTALSYVAGTGTAAVATPTPAQPTPTPVRTPAPTPTPARTPVHTGHH